MARGSTRRHACDTNILPHMLKDSNILKGVMARVYRTCSFGIAVEASQKEKGMMPRHVTCPRGGGAAIELRVLYHEQGDVKNAQELWEGARRAGFAIGIRCVPLGFSTTRKQT